MNIRDRFSLLLVALFVSAFSLGLSRSLADELPTDTNKIESLTPEQARKLVKDFPGVKLEFTTDKRWTSWGNGLPLQGLTTLDPKTAEELARFKGEAILLTGLSTLDVDTAKSFAAYAGDVVVSEEVQKKFLAKHPLSPETALGWAVVAEGDFSHIPALDLASAKALAEFKGRRLSLNGLPALDADTAKALAGFKGLRLSLNGSCLENLATFGPDTVKALAAAKWWNGDLSAVTALDSPDSVEIAQALATRKGPLMLPNLRKISPKTLYALIEKKDVALPLIEALELIPEPDGSPTVDFIIPDWLEARQN
jgi:hypothetical protein